MGRMGRTGQCGPVSPLFHFLYNIHTVGLHARNLGSKNCLRLYVHYLDGCEKEGRK